MGQFKPKEAQREQARMVVTLMAARARTALKAMSLPHAKNNSHVSDDLKLLVGVV